MKREYNKIAYAILSLVFIIAISSCQKMGRPGLGEYPKDANPPGGPLKFYTAFDGTSADKLMNAVDSIKATFPADNPLTSTDGISGKALSGESKKFVKYPKPNDWAALSKSFTISFWEKRNGQTKNNTGTNGPEYPFSFKSSNGHWSGGNVFLLFEGNNAACAVKFVIVDKNMGDNWFTWEGGNMIAGLLDDTWHHIALVYDAATSGMTLYVDGVANSIVPKWVPASGPHGDINIDDSKISEFRIGAGPLNSFDTDDWLSSTWKGSLDQFRFYNTALPAAEVNTLFKNKQ
ncbi:LamG domain-containing protein [Pseudoflavitalea sp. X16]|uniref:LamG domain-containing protein n=1 Tax=Paraflavitalea devenefica TaxID=2716334 RepID=UPI001423CE9D|nr:LamG domain-containing protein [Paraflavitalea devenefica]NII24317.1 LamG domain-containing protein [Paraflavitalea devenefica]